MLMRTTTENGPESTVAYWIEWLARDPILETYHILQIPRRWCYWSQSCPNSSAGCGARMVPLPQRMSSAGQNLSHPQQILSGCLGWSGSFGTELVWQFSIVDLHSAQGG